MIVISENTMIKLIDTHLWSCNLVFDPDSFKAEQLYAQLLGWA